MDPGRKRIEERELEFVTTGEKIITDTGVLWTVTDHKMEGDYVTLWMERQHGDRTIEGSTSGLNGDTVKVRNYLTSNS